MCNLKDSCYMISGMHIRCCQKFNYDSSVILAVILANLNSVIDECLTKVGYCLL